MHKKMPEMNICCAVTVVLQRSKDGATALARMWEPMPWRLRAEWVALGGAI